MVKAHRPGTGTGIELAFPPRSEHSTSNQPNLHEPEVSLHVQSPVA